MKMSRLILITTLSVICSFGYGQNGTIRGSIIDDETGETLIGATAQIEGTTQGSPADIDGKFSINGVAAGTYNLLFSYVGYQQQRVEGVTVKSGDVAIVDVRLKTFSVGLKEVTITASALKDTEAAFLTVQRKATQVMDGISSEQFSKIGDNDVGAAIKRVTGVSIQDGKYVFVRGLGDRYGKTSLNGADIPGLDPNRNSVQLDLFPTNIVENIIIYKTFSPDLPGDFTGGYADIITKDFPEEFTLQLSGSWGFNTQATFNDKFLTYKGGSTDFLGFDNGDREYPQYIRQNGVPTFGTNNGALGELNKVGNSFKLYQFDAVNESQFLNQRYAVSLGNQVYLGKKPLGYIAALTYNRSYNSYTDGVTGRYGKTSPLATSLNKDMELTDNQSTESVLWGASLNLSYKISDLNKISLNVMRNQSSDKSAREQFGISYRDNADANFVPRTLGFIERSITSYQLKGDHLLEGLGRMRINWIASLTESTQDEPDLKFFTYTQQDDLYSIQASVSSLPGRYYRDLNEDNFNGRINFELPYKAWAGLESKIKFGFSFTDKTRAFREDRIEYYSNLFNFDGNIDGYLTDNLVNNDKSSGTYPVILTQPSNNYDADQSVVAGYLMTELAITGKLKFIGGARLETTDIFIKSFDVNSAPGSIDEKDILPSVNLVYNVNDQMNVRMAYTKTLARPSFREIAPFYSFEFQGDFLVVGNPGLQRTLIDNYDLRWEYFPRSGEVYSLSGFYKKFDGPIERTFNIGAQNQEISWRNTPEATLYGVEAEFKKRLDFIVPALQNFTLGTNVSYVQSTVDIDPQELVAIRATDPGAEDTRRLLGQSDIVINAFLSYQSQKGTNANVSYYVNSDRIFITTGSGTPNVIEKARPTLGFRFSQAVNKKLSVNASGNNLLNPYFDYVYKLENREFIYQRYKEGATYSLGVTYKLN